MAKNESEWMCGAQLAAMLGISAMSLWRWERDTKLNFPRPTVIRDRKYWSRAAVNKWMRDTAVGKASRTRESA
jgi:predicted DNA-binding transcriptional regulator AlpA